MTVPKLSVVVPCYNEEKRFKDGFNHYYSYLKKQKYPWELILVNDGSVDNTVNLIRKYTKDISNLKVITYSQNRGKGYAIVQGIKKATGQTILFTDLDHSVPINTIEQFFNYFDKGFDIVIGSRRVIGANILVHQPPLREFLGRCFTVLVNLFIGWGITDATCGFKAFKYNMAKRLFTKITIYDWAFDAEILFLTKKLNFKIAQVPVIWSDVKGTKVSLLQDIVKSLVGLFKIRLNDMLGKYSV